MLRAILNESWRQHPTRHQLYSHQPPITKTIPVRRTRHAGHRWRSRDELISDVLLWTPTYGRAKAGRPARTYIQRLCEDTGCSPEDLPEAMNDRDKWRERVRDICASGTTWWWWWWWWFLVATFAMCREGVNFSWFLKISSFSYNTEYWVWNTNVILTRYLKFHVSHFFAYFSTIFISTSSCHLTPIAQSISILTFVCERSVFEPRVGIGTFIYLTITI